ncbi:TonB-dependent siderophore receptor, partial [Pseudomonas gingeri]|nr:TonB-dependent siderophore receptor [Pseudomonas gingeri]
MSRFYRTSPTGGSAPRFALNLLTLGLLSATGLPTARAATELAPVSVVGESDAGYNASSASVGGFDAAPLLDTPASISVVTESLIKDQQARLL